MIDFLTYVLVPVVALWRSDLMPTQVSFSIELLSRSRPRSISLTPE